MAGQQHGGSVERSLASPILEESRPGGHEQMGEGKCVVGKATHNRIKFLMGKVDRAVVRDARSTGREGWRFSLPGPPSPAHTTTRSRPRDVCKRCKTLRLEPAVCQGGRGATHGARQRDRVEVPGWRRS